MQRHFDDELKEIQTDLLKMGALVEDALAKAIEALKTQDKQIAQQVIEQDDVIDTLELDIDEKCLDLIARHQPMAKDLRFLATGIKVNAELERIADLAVDVAQRVLELADQPLLKPLVDIPKLSLIAKQMIKEAIDAFVANNNELAKKIILLDAQADLLKTSIQKEIVYGYLVKDGALAPRAVPLLLVARHLERICDHATNIAEDVIYMTSGDVVKHHPEKLSM